MYINIDNIKQMEYQSDLRQLFQIIEQEAELLTWLISFHEFEYLLGEKPDNRLNPNEDIIRIIGKDLIKIISKYKIKFKWGVLSGCKDIPYLENIDFEKLQLNNYGEEPFVYDEAEIEIDFFDGTSTIVRSENKFILMKLADYFKTEIKGEVN